MVNLAGFLLAAALIYFAGPAYSLAAGAGANLPAPQNLSIPSGLPHLSMRATMFVPAGKGPFPLAIINHGSEEDARTRAKMPMPAFPALTAWLVARGYAVVLPERPGHGATGGPYLESQGACLFPDYVKAARGTAQSITATIDYMVQQSFIRPTGVIVIGNSAGGWGGLALASENPPGVAGVINFAGGRGGRNHNKADNNCAPDRLVSASGEFGKTARVPTLWLYAKNDSFFSPTLAAEMHQSFVAAGGRGELDILPAVRGDGHALINTAGKEASWGPVLAKFLHGLARAAR